jgi:hypothetical protein
MRRLAITGFCTIALLSGCGGPQPKVVHGTKIGLPCNGKDHDSGNWDVDKIKQTVVFHTDGRCKFTKVYFDPSNKHFSDPVIDPTDGQRASSNYDGTPIPYPPGYKFIYENNYALDGNGSGVIKNPKSQ